MRKKRKHFKNVYQIKKPPTKEVLHTQNGSIPLNIARNDRISFSVLRDKKIQSEKLRTFHMKYASKTDGNGLYDMMIMAEKDISIDTIDYH